MKELFVEQIKTKNFEYILLVKVLEVFFKGLKRQQTSGSQRFRNNPSRNSLRVTER
jgi:hypothetical protein